MKLFKPINTKLLLVILLLSYSTVFLGQDDPLLDDTEAVLDSEQIDIDGQYQQRPTAADRMAKQRKKMEQQHDEMVRKKIEDMRVKEEKKLGKKLKNIMTGKQKKKKPEQKPPKVIVKKPEEKKPLRELKIIPHFGVTMINGDQIDFESKISLGAFVESMVHQQVSVGIGFNYTSFDLVDMDSYKYNNYYDQYNNEYNYYYNNPYYGRGYVDYYGRGRELGYKKWLIEFNSKFFFTVRTRVRPYAGVGLGYNRTSLKYKDQGRRYFNDNYNFSYGDEEYISSYLSGSILLGTEIIFTDLIGMNLEFKYFKGFTSGFNSESGPMPTYNLDQYRLDTVGAAIEDAHFISINLGCLIRF